MTTMTAKVLMKMMMLINRKARAAGKLHSRLLGVKLPEPQIYRRMKVGTMIFSNLTILVVLQRLVSHYRTLAKQSDRAKQRTRHNWIISQRSKIPKMTAIEARPLEFQRQNREKRLLKPLIKLVAVLNVLSFENH